MENEKQKGYSQVEETRINAYICNDLHVTITKDVDKGTTPMFISCPTCGERATSRMYSVNQSFTPEHEWYKPTDADVEKEVDQLLANDKDDSLPAKKILMSSYNDHVKNGGLLMRKIEHEKAFREKMKIALDSGQASPL